MTDDPMTVAEWIDRKTAPVPVAFRPYLDHGDPLSLDALLSAAESRIRKLARTSDTDRASAFALLAADAFVTYACLMTVSGGGDGSALRRIAHRIGQWWPLEEMDAGVLGRRDE